MYDPQVSQQDSDMNGASLSTSKPAYQGDDKVPVSHSFWNELSAFIQAHEFTTADLRKAKLGSNGILNKLINGAVETRMPKAVKRSFLFKVRSLIADPEAFKSNEIRSINDLFNKEI